MVRIVSVLNQKGGVSKTTTAHALGTGLTAMKKRVLMIDADGQCNLTVISGVMPGTGTKEALQGKSVKDLIVKSQYDIDLLRANYALTDMNVRIAGQSNEYRLYDALKPVKDNYDYIIIDCPTVAGAVVKNALVASDFCILPILPDVLSLQAVEQTNRTIEEAKRNNPNLKIAGILITRYNKRAKLTGFAVDLAKAKAGQMGTKVFKSMIREAVAVREAQAYQQSIFDYATKSNPGKDYVDFLNEFLKDMEG